MRAASATASVRLGDGARAESTMSSSSFGTKLRRAERVAGPIGRRGVATRVASSTGAPLLRMQLRVLRKCRANGANNERNQSEISGPGRVTARRRG